MEDIARDPDIGPEFITLLTQKVKSTREALNISLKDNADLRKEITEIKEQVQKLSTKSGAIGGQAANVTCQFGQCTSKDAVESLRLQLAETAEKLKATQEALAESLNEISRLKGNYGRAKGRAHERQEAVLELQAGSRGFPDTQEQINSSGPELPVSSEDIPGPEADNASGPPTVQSSTPSTDERTSQPCMPPHMAPCQVPKGLMYVASFSPIHLD
ncbi:hypothetical protein BC629DRAFT_977171 [Irpex lacteus]|nr:hypothetical protein BC629DRAFT_977171 [Irpex lacteus]